MKTGRYSDIFELAARCRYPSAVVIGTNCIVKNDGRAVMGAGIAAQAKKYDANVDRNLGRLITANRPAVTVMDIIGQYESIIQEPVRIINFPTKRDWRDNSDLELIRQSAYNLQLFANQHPEIKVFFLHKFGCGCGKLPYSMVKPVLEGILTDDNRFKMVMRPDDKDFYVV